MPTRLNLAFFAPMQADKPYMAALCRRMPSLSLLASFGALAGILGILGPRIGTRPAALSSFGITPTNARFGGGPMDGRPPGRLRPAHRRCTDGLSRFMATRVGSRRSDSIKHSQAAR